MSKFLTAFSWKFKTNQVGTIFKSKRLFSISYNKNLVNEPLYNQKSISSNFYYKKYIELSLKIKSQMAWKTEALLSYQKNNTKFFLTTLSTSLSFNRVYLYDRYEYADYKKSSNSVLLWSVTAGRLGFSRGLKKTTVAGQQVAVQAFWFLRVSSSFFTPLLFKIRGTRKFNQRHNVELHRFLNKETNRQKVFAFQDYAPIKCGDVTLKHFARKRYRHHLTKYFKFQFSTKNLLPSAKEYNKFEFVGPKNVKVIKRI